jgi:uncharacterized protein DUF1569
MQELDLSRANDFLDNHLKNAMDKLHSGLPPLWGMMTPQHAVEHLTEVVKASNGKVQFEVHTPAEKLPKYKRFLHHNFAMARNYKAPILPPDELLPLRNDSLESAVAGFWREWADFDTFFEKNPDATPNNAVFGPLTKDEWRSFHFKHFVHHLSQFGVTTSEAHGLVNG